MADPAVVIRRQNNIEQQSSVDSNDSKYMLIMDIGTTTFKLKVINDNLYVVHAIDTPMSCVDVPNRENNLDADRLWECILESLKHPKIPKIYSISITCHRNSFLFWDKESGNAVTSINTWKDKFAKNVANELNGRTSIKAFQLFNSIKYKINKNEMDAIKATFRFKCIHVSTRLYALLKNDHNIFKSWDQGKILYGTLETWLLWKLTNGQVYISEETFASTTGLYNVIKGKYHTSLCQFLKLPIHLLPPVVAQINANMSESILGYSVPITSLIADQQASLYGVGAHDEFSCKITMGTGIFITVNTGNLPLSIIKNKCYPIVAWDIGNVKTYAFETYNSNGAKYFEQLKTNNHVTDYHEIDHISTLLIEKLCNNKSDIPSNVIDIIDILEKYIFNIFICWLTIGSNINKKFDMIRVDGRISKCNFILQYLSNLTKCQIRRCNPDSTCFGVAMLAGRKLKVINDETIKNLIFADSNDVFLPQNDKLCKYCLEKFNSYNNKLEPKVV